MKIDEYVNRLEKFGTDPDAFVYSIIQRYKRYILAAPKRRMYNFGKDINLRDFTPSYTDLTDKIKREKGQRISHVTLRDTGVFYESLDLIKSGRLKYEMISKDEKYPLIREHYSYNQILGFSEQEVEWIFSTFIEPEIDDLINVNLELEF